MQGLASSPRLLPSRAALDPRTPLGAEDGHEVGHVPSTFSASLLDPDQAHALGEAKRALSGPTADAGSGCDGVEGKLAPAMLPDLQADDGQGCLLSRREVVPERRWEGA